MTTHKKINELDEAAKRLNAARGAVENMTYGNFKSGDLYQGLQRDYQQQGQRAMKDTLGQIAARTGGIASSYATTAANQSYNNYMQGLEDIARSMFNDEYSRAKDKYNTALNEYNMAYNENRDAINDDRYNKEWDYRVGRDALDDERHAATEAEAARQKEESALYDMAYYGNATSYDDYKAKGGILSEADYNRIVSIAQGKRTDENRTTVDTELKALLGAEDLKWGDWDKNGMVDAADVTAAPDFSRSSFGEDFWKQYWTDAQSEYKEDKKTMSAADIEARIANGESLDDIATEYGIPEDGKTWEDVTGMSEAEWRQMYNDNQTKNYTYQGEKGAAAMASRAIFGDLDPNEQENFDYLYGPGAYNTVQSAKTVIGNLQVYDEQSLDDPQTTDELDNAIASLMMIGFNDTQIANLIKAVNPTLEEIYFKP